jgi:predicted transcriptional regulator of viral defense system
MKFEELLKLINGEPIFTSSLLLAGNISVFSIRKQLSRWISAGKILQIKRGLYVVAAPYMKKEPHPFLIANMIKKASYVSLQSALEYYGTIPEYVPVITSVTTGRPEQISTKLGKFIFKHLKKELFWGYKELEVIKGTGIFIATPEKALLDLIYFTPNSDKLEYIEELRLQNIEKIDTELLINYSRTFKKPKIERAAHAIKKFIHKFIHQ